MTRNFGKWIMVALFAFHAPRAFSLTVAELKEIIQRKNLKTVPEVLAELPPEYLKNYTLMYESHGLQSASYQNPRAILFGTDAKLVIGFNGHESQTLFNDIELLEYSDSERKFTLSTIRLASDQAVFSEANPPLCLTCHGTEAKPIWDSYSTWHGAYGSNTDFVDNNNDEIDNLKEFLANKSEHPRYKYLYSSVESDIFPYVSEDSPYSGMHKLRPNNRLGVYLGQLNSHVMARTIEESDYFKNHQATVLMSLLECPESLNHDYTAKVEKAFYQKFPLEFYSNLNREYVNYPSNGPKRLPWRNYFLLEKLTSGLGVYTWVPMKLGPIGNYFDNKPDVIAHDFRYMMSGGSGDEAIAARIFEYEAKDDPAIVEHLKTEPFEYVYSQLNIDSGYPLPPGTYQKYVGDIGKYYDALGSFFNRDEAKKLCPLLTERSNAEN